MDRVVSHSDALDEVAQFIAAMRQDTRPLLHGGTRTGPHGTAGSSGVGNTGGANMSGGPGMPSANLGWIGDGPSGKGGFPSGDPNGNPGPSLGRDGTPGSHLGHKLFDDKVSAFEEYTCNGTSG